MKKRTPALLLAAVMILSLCVSGPGMRAKAAFVDVADTQFGHLAEAIGTSAAGLSGAAKVGAGICALEKLTLTEGSSARLDTIVTGMDGAYQALDEPYKGMVQGIYGKRDTAIGQVFVRSVVPLLENEQKDGVDLLEECKEKYWDCLTEEQRVACLTPVGKVLAASGIYDMVKGVAQKSGVILERLVSYSFQYVDSNDNPAEPHEGLNFLRGSVTVEQHIGSGSSHTYTWSDMTTYIVMDTEDGAIYTMDEINDVLGIS